ncbi:MAG TPA: protein phosphatase 2C domain-containing protein [Blastocatellia bacterium]|nr:protein phosphatase 2C domain-containing protein [Blastocatellia bacterium]
MELKVGSICDRGLNPRRTVNQDRFLALPERGLFAVFDGVGGQRAGEVASQTAAETIEEALAGTDARLAPDLIRRAIEFANRDIYELAESDPAYRTMATTVALLHLDHDRATIAHVGDSRVYRLEDGRIYRETIDHTDLNDRVRAGLISAEQAAGQEESNVINRALGVGAEVDVEIKTIRLREGTRFLLCSDGVYKHLTDEEIARMLAAYEDPQRAAEELKRAVYERGADDNLTAIIVQAGRAKTPVAKAAAGRKTTKLSEAELLARRASAGEHDWVFAEPEPPAESRAKVRSRASRPTTKLAESEITSRLTAKPETEAGGGRIRVEFANALADGASGQEQTSAPGRQTSHKRADGTWSGTRILMYTLLALVLAVGAFYAGLRASDYMERNSSESAQADGAQAQLLPARELFEKGDYEAAATLLSGVLSRDPRNAQAHYWLGRALLEQHEYAKAAQNFEQAFTLQPALHDAYVQAAAAYEAADNRRKAAEMLARYAEERRRQGTGNRGQGTGQR